MVADDGGAQVPELVRRMALTSPDHDPVPALVDVLGRLVFSGVGIADAPFPHIWGPFHVPHRSLVAGFWYPQQIEEDGLELGELGCEGLHDSTARVGEVLAGEPAEDLEDGG